MFSSAPRGIAVPCLLKLGLGKIPATPSLQDGWKLRRYRHRCKVQRTISWMENGRRLLVRHKHYDHRFYGFAQLPCIQLPMKLALVAEVIRAEGESAAE